MIKMETETRCLGKLEHHGEFDPEEEQDGMNVSELVRTLIDGVKKFEDDQMMIDFCKQYGELFNNNEFNLYESSKDDDSEGESDGDNENNNHDDDGAPTADANKQKEKKSGSKGTKENESEATEGESDGKEENMNGDDREVTVQMDVDNQNKELNKEKDDNETEDNDKMNNNEMKNDSVQEKQDIDKDENAEKEKVETKKRSRIKLTRDEQQRKENKTLFPHRDDYMFKWKKEDGKRYDEVKQYKAFSDIMKNEFKKDDELKKIKRSRIAHEHYYLIVFNILKGTTVIIDNSKTLMTCEAKYNEVYNVLHQRAKDVLNKKPTILRPKWWDKGKQHRLWGFLDDARGELQRGECKELEPEIPNRGKRK
nr:hypothetical protein [Tanacetum cinerariifolium]